MGIYFYVLVNYFIKVALLCELCCAGILSVLREFLNHRLVQVSGTPLVGLPGQSRVHYTLPVVSMALHLICLNDACSSGPSHAFD